MTMAKSIKVGKELWERIERAAKAGGYSSPQEFAEHVLEKYVPRSDETHSKEEILNRLKGLGYIE
jgi:metal-responsive CopG/Arc/MetJ family transcriptional regulator